MVCSFAANINHLFSTSSLYRYPFLIWYFIRVFPEYPRCKFTLLWGAARRVHGRQPEYIGLLCFPNLGKDLSTLMSFMSSKIWSPEPASTSSPGSLL